MIRAILIFLLGAAASLCSSLEDGSGNSPAEGVDGGRLLARQVTKPTTPNQILDAIADRAAAKMAGLKWNISKAMNDSYSVFPLQVNLPVATASEEFTITNAVITGLGSLRRSKSASFNPLKTVLLGTLVLDNICITANYTLVFQSLGAAPAQDLKGGRGGGGGLKECVTKLFADLQVALSRPLVPQRLLNYVVRSGHDELKSMAGLDQKGMAPIHEAGARRALRDVLEKTMNTDVKGMVTQAILSMKAGM
ncbi:uncharacterized protein LOC135202811 [Macrobrachium nipponense]|uniref:uncharacterized protein LOC135202811 n=1 Tax=Macrobrachium nipponense TaxID=159736 RepID=UPI0030C86919